MRPLRRPLKTKFPCAVCGEPAEVERLREAPMAVCEQCARRRWAVSRVNWKHEFGRKNIVAVNGKAAAPELVAGWLRGMGEHLEAIALRVEALPDAAPVERRRLALGGREWFDYVVRNMGDLRPILFEVTDGTGFGVVSGGGEGPLSVAPAGPGLRLVRKHGESEGSV